MLASKKRREGDQAEDREEKRDFRVFLHEQSRGRGGGWLRNHVKTRTDDLNIRLNGVGEKT